jgi:hypothetical protein
MQTINVLQISIHAESLEWLISQHVVEQTCEDDLGVTTGVPISSQSNQKN